MKLLNHKPREQQVIPMSQVSQKDNHFKVFVQGNFANAQSGALMEGHPSGAFKVTREISEANLIVWTGGEDINPELYNEKRLPCTGSAHHRDTYDLAALKIAKTNKAVMVGLCRGAQFLNVLVGGGKLWQDVDNHGYGDHVCTDYVTAEKVKLNSLHHQMMIPGPDALVVCGTMVANNKYSYDANWDREDAIQSGLHSDLAKDLIDPEVIWYEKEKALCIQAHPEFAHKATRDYFYSLVSRYILNER